MYVFIYFIYFFLGHSRFSWLTRIANVGLGSCTVLKSVRSGVAEAPAHSHDSSGHVCAESPTRKASHLPNRLGPMLPGTAVYKSCCLQPDK